ncbi:hypothetical protein LTR27_011734 [Elasticomyces elasticus]|nr:hypothetical protein LTR27_011734 [Elasticomyces elasticus]
MYPSGGRRSGGRSGYGGQGSRYGGGGDHYSESSSYGGGGPSYVPYDPEPRRSVGVSDPVDPAWYDKLDAFEKMDFSRMSEDQKRRFSRNEITPMLKYVRNLGPYGDPARREMVSVMEKQGYDVPSYGGLACKKSNLEDFEDFTREMGWGR